MESKKQRMKLQFLLFLIVMQNPPTILFIYSFSVLNSIPGGIKNILKSLKFGLNLLCFIHM